MIKLFLIFAPSSRSFSALFFNRSKREIINTSFWIVIMYDGTWLSICWSYICEEQCTILSTITLIRDCFICKIITKKYARLTSMQTDVKHQCNGHSHMSLAQFRIVPQFELRSYCVVCGLLIKFSTIDAIFSVVSVLFFYFLAINLFPKQL